MPLREQLVLFYKIRGIVEYNPTKYLSLYDTPINLRNVRWCDTTGIYCPSGEEVSLKLSPKVDVELVNKDYEALSAEKKTEVQERLMAKERLLEQQREREQQGERERQIMLDLIKKEQQKSEIESLLDYYLIERTVVKDSSGRTKEYFHGRFFSAFQKSFTQKRDAVNALKSALKGNNVDLNEHLSTLRNGDLGKKLRAYVKSGKGTALVGKEVTTVSDLVEYLPGFSQRSRQFY